MQARLRLFKVRTSHGYRLLRAGCRREARQIVSFSLLSDEWVERVSEVISGPDTLKPADATLVTRFVRVARRGISG